MPIIKQMSYFLFLDDERHYNQVKFPIPENYEVKTARNYSEFCDILAKNGLPRVVSFDFDLHEEHYKRFQAVQDGSFNPEFFQNKCGLHCARHLIDLVKKEKAYFPQYFSHSANPKGKSLILKELNNAAKN